MANAVKTSQAQQHEHSQKKQKQEGKVCNYADNYYGDQTCTASKDG